MGGTWENNAPYDDSHSKRWDRIHKLRKIIEKKYPDLYEWITLELEELSR